MGTTTAQFTLELYFEQDGDCTLAEATSAGLWKVVAHLAPHVQLIIEVQKATHIVRSEFEAGGVHHNVPNHNPSISGRQAILITSESIGGEGWAGPGRGVVSKPAIEAKKEAGGDATDILLHEWLHTIEGSVINGRSVPYADHAEQFGFHSVPGGDDQPTWHSWFRFALGG
jgi:hypothetical protein